MKNTEIIKPTLKENPDLAALRKLINEYIDYIDSDEYHEDNDYRYYIYEAAIEAYLGVEFWGWLNAKES